MTIAEVRQAEAVRRRVSLVKEAEFQLALQPTYVQAKMVL